MEDSSRRLGWCCGVPKLFAYCKGTLTAPAIREVRMPLRPATMTLSTPANSGHNRKAYGKLIRCIDCLVDNKNEQLLAPKPLRCPSPAAGPPIPLSVPFPVSRWVVSLSVPVPASVIAGVPVPFPLPVPVSPRFTVTRFSFPGASPFHRHNPSPLEDIIQLFLLLVSMDPGPAQGKTIHACEAEAHSSSYQVTGVHM